MGLVVRQSVKASIAIFSGAVLGGLIHLLGPKLLSKTELGLNRNLINQAAVLQFIALLGFHHVLAVFLPRYNLQDPRRRVLLLAGAIIPLLSCLLLCIPYFLFKDFFISKYQSQDIPLLQRFWAWLPVLTLLWSTMSMVEGYLIAEKKIAYSAFAREVLLRIGALALLLLAGAGWLSFSGFIAGNVLIYGLPLLALLWMAWRLDGFGFSSNWSALSRAEWLEIGRFAWYHLLTGVVMNLIGFLDALMLAPLDATGMQSVAVYAIAGFIASMLSIPYKALAGAAFPVMNEAFIQKDMTKVQAVFVRSGINILILGIGLSIAIIPNLSLLVTLLPPSFGAVPPIALILMLGRLLDLLTGMNSEVISISSHYKFLFRISFLLVAVLIFSNRILIPRYGIYGAAWSATLSMALFNMAKMLFLWLRFRLHPFSRATLLVIVAGVIAGGLGWMVPDIGPVVLALGLRTAVVLLLFGGLILWWKPSPDLQAYLLSIRKSKRLF